MRNKISSWVRQSRHRAKKHGVISRLEVEDVQGVLDVFNGCCAYCGATATTLDHPFPLGSKAPNVLANILPSCQGCKTKKGAGDLVIYLTDGHITQDEFINLIRSMLSRPGGDLLREHIKGITGIGL